MCESSDKVASLLKVVMKMNTFEDANSLIISTIDGDRNEMLRLKKEMGSALRPILGLTNGYYSLDLTREIDRLCLGKLIELSSTYAKERRRMSPFSYSRAGDLSQTGAWRPCIPFSFFISCRQRISSHINTQCNAQWKTQCNTHQHTSKRIHQHTSTQCNTMQHTTTHINTQCNTHQHTSKHTSTHASTHINTHQHTSTHTHTHTHKFLPQCHQGERRQTAGPQHAAPKLL